VVVDERVLGAYRAKFRLYIELLDRMSVEDDDVAFVRRHLEGLDGKVLDLGCGPGQWSEWLHSLGLDVLGIDLVPEFIAHARWAHAGPEFRLGSITELEVPDGSAAGALAWFSTIHLPPPSLDEALTEIHRVVAPGGTAVLGFFDSEHDVVEFEHKVTTAWRWPLDTFASRLAAAGLEEVERFRWTLPERPDRRYAAIAARRT
jgi:SAM-dependent methyltransferase